jgi:hypothetical protein
VKKHDTSVHLIGTWQERGKSVIIFCATENDMETSAYFRLLFGLYLLTSAKLHCRYNQLLQNREKFCEVTPEENIWLETSHELISF